MEHEILRAVQIVAMATGGAAVLLYLILLGAHTLRNPYVPVEPPKWAFSILIFGLACVCTGVGAAICQILIYKP